MNMAIMAIILVSIYFTSLAAIIIFRDHIDTRIGNAVFICLDVIFFIALHLNYYNRGAFSTFLTLDNISPFTFTLLPFSYLMKDKVKDYFFSFVAFICLGMFGAMLVSPNYAYLFQQRLDASFDYVFDAFNHLVVSLFGVYLVVTKQVKPNMKQFIKGSIFIYSVITIIVIINLLFHTRYFGMAPYGNYSIYMLNIFGSFGATLLGYILGLALILFTGYELCYLIYHILEKKNPEPSDVVTETPIENEETPTV